MVCNGKGIIMSKTYVVIDKNNMVADRLIDSIHQIPNNAIQVQIDVWRKIIDCSAGQWRMLESGKFELVPYKSLPMTESEIESSRVAEYANPITGSDRLFSEASRMQVMGEDGAENAKEKAIARYKEIQAQYPWPAK